MTTIRIGQDNDIQIDNNNLTLIEGREEIAQVLRQRLRVFLGEWFLDTREGIDYYGQILKKLPDPGQVDSLFKNEILTSPGVIELIDFNLEIEGRQLQLTFTARTADGIITFNEDLT
jgi:hypothetical protein